MKPIRLVRNLALTLKGLNSVKTKSKITAVNIKTKKAIQEYLKLAQVLIRSGKV